MAYLYLETEIDSALVIAPKSVLQEAEIELF